MFYWNMVMKMLKCKNENLMMSHFCTLLHHLQHQHVLKQKTKSNIHTVEGFSSNFHRKSVNFKWSAFNTSTSTWWSSLAVSPVQNSSMHSCHIILSCSWTWWIAHLPAQDLLEKWQRQQETLPNNYYKYWTNFSLLSMFYVVKALRGVVTLS